MLFSLHLRAESLAWAAEGVSRHMGHDQGGLGAMLTELGRQPGVAFIAIVDPSGKILLDSNRQLEGSLLYTPAELSALDISPTLQGRFSPDDPQVFETWKIFRPGRFNHGGRPSHKERGNIIFVALDASFLDKDLAAYKDQLWLMASLLLVSSLCLSALVYATNRYLISRRRMLDAKALSTQVVSSYPGPMLITDLSGNILLANDPARERLDIIDNKLNNSSALDFPVIMAELASSGAILARELELKDKKGKSDPISLSAAVIKDARGEKAGYLLAINDLAEIKRLQNKLADAERAAALVNLAAGVAHEIRNPLSSICGYASYLKNRLAADPVGETTASLLEEEAQRLNSALCDLLNLVKEPKLNISRQSLPALLDKTAALAKPDADDKNISIQIDYPAADAPDFYADSDKLLQCLLNITLNAIQAAPTGGHVEIAARYIAEGDNLSKSGVWEISVADNGKGMPDNMLKKIFTPYFTTKAEGAGLGLTITKRIVEAHKGKISAANTQAGFKMIIILPGKEPCPG